MKKLYINISGPENDYTRDKPEIILKDTLLYNVMYNLLNN